MDKEPIRKNSRPNKKRKKPSRIAMARAEIDMVNRHASQLSEHFTGVTILVTKLEPNGTTSSFSSGSGDIYSRTQHAECWLDSIVPHL